MLFLHSLHFATPFVFIHSPQFFNLFPMFCLFKVQITFESLSIFFQLSYLKLVLFTNSNQLSVRICYLIIFLFTVFLEFPDFQLISFNTIHISFLKILNLILELMFDITELFVLKMFHFDDILLQFINLIEQSFDFHISCCGSVGSDIIQFIFPYFYLSLLLIDQSSKSLVFIQQLVIVFEDELDFLFKLGYFLVFILCQLDLLD